MGGQVFRSPTTASVRRLLIRASHRMGLSHWYTSAFEMVDSHARSTSQKNFDSFSTCVLAKKEFGTRSMKLGTNTGQSFVVAARFASVLLLYADIKQCAS